MPDFDFEPAVSSVHTWRDRTFFVVGYRFTSPDSKMEEKEGLGPTFMTLLLEAVPDAAGKLDVKFRHQGWDSIPLDFAHMMYDWKKIRT